MIEFRMKVTIFMCVFSIRNVLGQIKLLSKELSDKLVVEGDSLTLNCTLTGRQTTRDRISWIVDWTANNIDDSRFFFAEENMTEHVMSPKGSHGVYTFEYERIQNGVNESDAIHICLLHISGTTLNDAGKYWCSYFDSEVTSLRQVLLPGQTNLFVAPNSNMQFMTTVQSAISGNTDILTTVGSSCACQSQSFTAKVVGITAAVTVIVVLVVEGLMYFAYTQGISFQRRKSQANANTRIIQSHQQAQHSLPHMSAQDHQTNNPGERPNNAFTNNSTLTDDDYDNGYIVPLPDRVPINHRSRQMQQATGGQHDQEGDVDDYGYTQALPDLRNEGIRQTNGARMDENHGSVNVSEDGYTEYRVQDPSRYQGLRK
ncbi:uncharacterized protein [Amphiura filiformis]|uniref:uncharacterized protein n=1 Tax=Amphiura filiformis TaxID=82378 RepID=UPI003B228CD2